MSIGRRNRTMVPFGLFWIPQTFIHTSELSMKLTTGYENTHYYIPVIEKSCPLSPPFIITNSKRNKTQGMTREPLVV